jgi:hypothetical protein
VEWSWRKQSRESLALGVEGAVRKSVEQTSAGWPAPGSEDTELGVLMELEVRHGEAPVYAGVQA